MKRVLALLLVFALCMGMCGCESKSEAVKQTEALIEAIGTVEVSSLEAIQSAWDSYALLPEAEQGAVENYDKLVAAQETYDSFYETVEVTGDNWNTYFAAETPCFWGVDAFGEANSVSVPLLVRVDAAYANRVDLNASGLVVRYSEDRWAWNCSVDWDNQELVLLSQAYYVGSEDAVWSSGDKQAHESRLAAQLAREYDDGNLVFFTFGSGVENSKPDVVGDEREYAEIGVFTVKSIVGTISMLKPEYEPYISPKEEAAEEAPVIEGYTPVELTMDNWQDYLELRYEGKWGTDAAGNLENYCENYDLYVKEEWRSKVKYTAGTNVQMKCSVDRTNVFYDVDWENRVFTMGAQADDFHQEEVIIAEYPMWWGYMLNADNDGYLAGVRAHIYVPITEDYNVEVDKKTGRKYTFRAVPTVTQIQGTLYIES